MDKLKELHDNKMKQLDQIREELKELETQQAELRKQHDAKLTVGIELQGAIKGLKEAMVLSEMKTEIPEA